MAFSYGEGTVLEGLNLTVARGSLLALTGPNGAGKSTLLRLIAGVLRPARGTLQVLGSDFPALSPRARAKLVAVVPQSPELPAGTAALEVVLMGRNPHLGLLAWETEADLEIALQAMRITGTEELADRLIDHLSGGERQRVAIALALAQQTPVCCSTSRPPTWTSPTNLPSCPCSASWRRPADRGRGDARSDPGRSVRAPGRPAQRRPVPVRGNA